MLEIKKNMIYYVLKSDNHSDKEIVFVKSNDELWRLRPLNFNMGPQTLTILLKTSNELNGGKKK